MSVEFERDGEPQRIPQSWADAGRWEIAADDQREAYAVRAAPGRTHYRAEYYVPGNRTHPDRERTTPQLEVLYVTADAQAAAEVRVDARVADGSMRPVDGFAAVRAVDADRLDSIGSFWAQIEHRRDLTALYGPEVLTAPFEADDGAFATGAELRAGGGDEA